MGEEREKKSEDEKAVEAKADKTQVFAVKTTVGQELNVANMMYNKVEMGKLPVYSILVTDSLKGYVFVEAAGPHFADEAASGVKHARQRLSGVVKPSELERYLLTKPVIEGLDVGDSVEVVSGPFKDMKGKITRIDKSKNDVTLELLETMVTLPITIHADYVRLIGKVQKEK